MMTFGEDGGSLACRTRDVSTTGAFLETPVLIAEGTPVALSLLDEDLGEAIAVEGVVARQVEAQGTTPAGLGIRLTEAPDAWVALIERAMSKQRDRDATIQLNRPARRLRILVVGDEVRRRGALALYVKSGWDVRFASDLDGATEALRGFKIDAVIAEHELDDGRWPQLLAAVRDAQPGALRIVRATLGGQPTPPPGGPNDLVHRVVDLDAGLDAVLEALVAEE